MKYAPWLSSQTLLGAVCQPSAIHELSTGSFLNGFTGFLEVLADARDRIAGGQGETQQQQNGPSFHRDSPLGSNGQEPVRPFRVERG
jgi:hypothetical protein